MTSARVKISIAALLVVILAGAAFWRMKFKRDEKKVLTVSLPEAPYSLDPLEHDWAVHHVTQRSVLSTLVTNYTQGRIAGVVAASWSVSGDQKQWSFKIKPGLTFADGKPIDAEAVRKSFTRMAFLMKQSGSKSGLLEFLNDLGSLTSANDIFDGIRAKQNDIVFQFSTPVDDALEKFSFGTYAIVHPDDFDESTGQWKDPAKVTPSGAYSIASSTDHGIRLRKRSNFSFEAFQEFGFEEVELIWPARIDSDVILTSGFDDPPRAGVTFLGGLESEIYYYRVVSWPERGSPLEDVRVRRALRDRFYEHLTKRNRTPRTSFLPLSLPGVEAFPFSSAQTSQQIEGLPVKGVELRILDYRHRGGWRLAACEAVFDAALEIGFAPRFVDASTDKIQLHKDPSLEKYEYDVSGAVTGIYPEAPHEGLRFMIESKEGIRLPDPSGRIGRIVSEPKFSIKDFNTALWDDALVWPVTHGATGLWVDQSKVDAIALDLIQVPTELMLLKKP